MPSRAVVWFRRDLRVADHPALLAALGGRLLVLRSRRRCDLPWPSRRVGRRGVADRRPARRG
jgi:hypothetical protein